MLGLAALMLNACDEGEPDAPGREARLKYLDQYHPQLRNLRDQIAAQIKACKSNITHLEKLNESFVQDESKNMVKAKIAAVKEQKAQLWQQLGRIDNQVERGIALKEFNVVDGGGERAQELEVLARECQQQVTSASRINNSIDNMYNGTPMNNQSPAAVEMKQQPVKQQSIKLSSVAFYPFYFELPSVNYSKLNQVFEKHPELFEIETDAGKKFIHTIRSYQQFNPNFFKDPNWIEFMPTLCNSK